MMGRVLRITALVMIVLTAGIAVIPPHGTARAAHVEDGALDNSAHFAYLEITRIRQRWVASWMKMTQHFSANMMHQMWITGMFFDAKHQMESQRLFERLANEAHKNYHPSEQMCRFGTNTRSLAAADELSRANTQIVSTILLNRELLSNNTVSGLGSVRDKSSRVRQFKRTYCDINDNNGRMREVCRLTADNDGEDYQRGAPDARTNADINYMTTVDSKYSLDINFTDSELTDDETDVLALARNLFAHDVFSVIPDEVMRHTDNRNVYQDARSIIAVRGIARNSFGHIIGQRAQSPNAQVADFLKLVVQEMGVPEEEVDYFLGRNPSYFAQMEVLTRKMYQNPSFYANLYTKPANVARAGAAIQAISLMQDRDRFEGALRREMLLSALLEMRLRNVQREVINQIQNFEPFQMQEAPAGP